ncbi:FimV family protein, partial [Burkholderia mallei]
MTPRLLSSTTIFDGLPRARRAVALAVLALAGASAAYAAPDAASAASAEQAAPLTITVRPGQSLNDIAVAVTQSHDPGVLARAGRALFDANPQAFMKRDPSRLKIGAQLMVPALDATAASAAASAASAASTSAVTGAAPHPSASASAPAAASRPAAAS